MMYPCTSPNHLGYHKQKVILAKLISVHLLRAKTQALSRLYTEEEAQRRKGSEKLVLFALQISQKADYGRDVWLRGGEALLRDS